MQFQPLTTSVKCMTVYLQFMLLLAIFPFVQSKNSNLAKTPPMAWMTWQRFRCTIDCEEFPDDCISESLIKKQAERMANDGWLAAGYDTIVIDDCWSEHFRNPKTRELIPDRKRFPGGILALSRFVHSLGLKFGIYGDYGTYTCEKYPASMGYEEVDAKTFASWEVDYIKLDGCFSTSEEQKKGYELFGNFLNATGRDIVYSCSYPAYLGGTPDHVDYAWLRSVCNLWRNYLDIDDSFYSVLKIIEWFGDNMDGLREFHGPSSWHDPDMLIVGNFGLTPWQGKIQFSIWAMLAAPLIMSNNLLSIDNSSREILLNPLAIGVNQDPLGIPGYRIGSRAGFEMWARPLVGNRIGVVIFSVRTDGAPKPFEFQIDFIREFIRPHFELKHWYLVEDVWKDHPNKAPTPPAVDVGEKLTIYLRPHSALFWILSPIKAEHDLDHISYQLRAQIRDSL